MPEQPRNVLNVLSVKQEDSRPPVRTSIADINEAEEQPTEDTSFDGYDGTAFQDANRIEFHLDFWDEENDEYLRVVDGRVATYDATAEEVSADLDRPDTARIGAYSFEWVLVFDEPDADGNVPSSETATEVQTVPKVGYFEIEVEEATARTLAELEPIDRTVGDLTVEGYIRGTNGPVPISGTQPTASNHAIHKQYFDTNLGEKADLDGGGTQELLGNALLDLVPIPEPTAPVGDAWRLYRDESDGSLKGKDENGNVETILSQP